MENPCTASSKRSKNYFSQDYGFFFFIQAYMCAWVIHTRYVYVQW